MAERVPIVRSIDAAKESARLRSALRIVVLTVNAIVGSMSSRPGRPGSDGELDRDRDDRGAMILDENPLGSGIDGPRRDRGG